MSKPSIDDLIAQYLAAIDAGEEPERERWMADHPEFAEELRDFFADFDRIRGAVERAEDQATSECVHEVPDPKDGSSSQLTGDSLSRLSDETLRRLKRLLQKAEGVETNQNETDTEASSAEMLGAPASIIGKYKLLQKIGSGGMGEVWLAEEEKPIRRRVALKLIKAGMDTKEVIARFEAERQALALMNHHNIAKVLDGGSTEHGRPYFVMELVQGIPITEYCDKNCLSVEERLKLFITVCNAVQHAHQKGIIHRDLKPSNILVTLYDGHPVAKVIDFGLAKALQHQARLTDKTLFTAVGQVVGTLQYMSPEQTEMNALDIDTRTDIYSLGVILYELLTGSTPIDRETVKANAFHNVLETIREIDPPRPSTRLTASGDAITGISQQRQIEAKKLNQILRGDLDWIVMKALSRDRIRRYDTALEFGQDIGRFISGLPVDAKPPSRFYVLKKYAVKHRGWVASIAVVLLTVLAGSAGVLYFAIAEQKARSQAELRGDRLQNSVMLLESVFRDINPNADEIGDAELRRRLASNLNSAIEQLKTAILKGDDDPETDIPLMIKMIETLESLGVSAWAQADHVRPMVDESTMLGKEIALKIDLYQAREKGVETVNNVVDRYVQCFGADDKRTIDASLLLAWLLSQTGERDDARSSIELYETILAKLDALGLSERRGLILYRLSYGYRGNRELERARICLEKAVEIFESRLGADHLNTLVAKRSLATLYQRADDRDSERQELLEEICESFEYYHGRWNAATCVAYMDLLVFYATHKKTPGYLERAQELLPEVEESYRFMCHSVGEDHADTMTMLSNLASAYGVTGNTEKCIEMHLELHERYTELYGSDDKKTQEHNRVLSAAYEKRGDFAKAIELMSAYIGFATQEYGLTDQRTTDAIWSRNSLWLASKLTQATVPNEEGTNLGTHSRDPSKPKVETGAEFDRGSVANNSDVDK